MQSAPFCAFCLRANPPNVEFYKHVVGSTPELRLSFQSMLGYNFKLADFSICKPCWKLMQLVQDFRLRCFKANGLAERVDGGLRAVDDWFSVKNLATIEAVRMVIKDQVQRIGRVEIGCDLAEDRQRELVSTIEIGEVKIEPEVADQEEPMVIEVEDEDLAEDASQSPTALIPQQCPKCDRILCNSKALKLHSMKCNGQTVTDSLFTCNICSASFKNRASYLAHLNNHDGKNPYKCQYCSRTFPCSKTWSNHEDNCHGRKYMVDCTLCDESLPNNQQLMDHYRRVHPGERIHQCSQCDERFTARYSLVLHVRRQHEKRPNTFSCMVCDKKYARRQDLKLHLKTHNREMPNPCEYCDERFTSSKLLKIHMAKVHPTFAYDEDLQELAKKEEVKCNMKTMLIKKVKKQ